MMGRYHRLRKKLKRRRRNLPSVPEETIELVESEAQEDPVEASALTAQSDRSQVYGHVEPLVPTAAEPRPQERQAGGQSGRDQSNQSQRRVEGSVRDLEYLIRQINLLTESVGMPRVTDVICNCSYCREAGAGAQPHGHRQMQPPQQHTPIPTHRPVPPIHQGQSRFLQQLRDHPEPIYVSQRQLHIGVEVERGETFQTVESVATSTSATDPGLRQAQGAAAQEPNLASEESYCYVVTPPHALGYEDHYFPNKREAIKQYVFHLEQPRRMVPGYAQRTRTEPDGQEDPDKKDDKKPKPKRF